MPLSVSDELIFVYEDDAVVDKAPLDKEMLSRFAVVDVAEAANAALKLERQGRRHEARNTLAQSIQETGNTFRVPAGLCTRKCLNAWRMAWMKWIVNPAITRITRTENGSTNNIIIFKGGSQGTRKDPEDQPVFRIQGRLTFVTHL